MSVHTSLHALSSLSCAKTQTALLVQAAKQAIQRLPGGLTINKLSKDDSLKQAAAFGTLAAWALIQVWHHFGCRQTVTVCCHGCAELVRCMCVLQALTDPPGVAQTDVPGLQLAIAVIASLYILRDKKRIGLGKTLRCLAQHLKRAWQSLCGASSTGSRTAYGYGFPYK